MKHTGNIQQPLLITSLDFGGQRARSQHAFEVATGEGGHPPSSPIFAQSSKMGTVTKGFDAMLANRPLLVVDFQTLWRSILSARVSESQKLKIVGWPAWRRIPELM